MCRKPVAILPTIAAVLLAAVITLTGCGGGGGGGGGASSTFTVGGAVFMPKDQPNALTEAYYSNAYTTVVLNGANVTLCKPTPDGIQLVSQAPVVTTSSYGSYSVEVDYSAITVESGQPLLVCASNANGTFTLLSMIPSHE